jgi:methionyl-tRNA formyltransferase
MKVNNQYACLMHNSRFVFFGTPEFSAIILDELERAGYLPALIVTAPDKPRGRGLVMTPSEVKSWGLAHNIPVVTPLTLKDESVADTLRNAECDLFIVAAYGKIIPRGVLGIPAHGVLNVHPSLLPKFRGASPIESAILSDESHTGVTIMLLDEEMDHGPIVAQRPYKGQTFGKVRPLYRDIGWPPKGSVLTRDLAHFGGTLLAEIIPEWMNGSKAVAQDHARATYTKKITKEDGLIDIAGDPLQNYRKIQAYDEWPGAHFFIERNGKNIRVRITDATYKEGSLTVIRVVPEGKKEMSYEDFLRGGQP